MKFFQSIILSFCLLSVSILAAPNYDNIIRNAVELQTTEGTQIIQMQEDGSVLSTEAIIGMTVSSHLKELTSQYSKSLSALRNSGERFVYVGKQNLEEDNVADACLQFIKNNYDKLGIEIENLRVQHIERSGRLWNVYFTQTYYGIDVKGGRIAVMINANNGRIQTFRSTFYDDVTVDKFKPIVSFQVAENAATVGLPNTNYEVSVIRPVIIPYISGSSFRYRLAYECKVEGSLIECFISTVDANTGELIERTNIVMDMNATSKHFDMNANDPLIISKIPLVDFWIDGVKYNSGPSWSGSTEPQIPASAIGKKFTTGLVGNRASMFHTDYSQTMPNNLIPMYGVPYEYEGTVTSNGIEMFNENNYDEVFRTVYQNVNRNWEFFKRIDPLFNGLDKSIKAYLQILPDNLLDWTGIDINAYARGDDILVFLGANSNVVFMAKSAQVAFHEYGHSRVYAKYNSILGHNMNNSAANEAVADITAAFITSNPRVFEYAFKDGITVSNVPPRNCENNWIFPDSLQVHQGGRRHFDSQLLSGAFWSLRNALGGNKKADTLAAFSVLNAKNYTPDGWSYEQVFSEWFESVIKATDAFAEYIDEDYDPYETPYLLNFNEIYTAFNRHKIGYDLLIQNRFTHKNIADQPKNAPISITATIAEIPAPKAIEDVWVRYYTNINSSTQDVLLTPVETANGIEYSGEIPPQQEGVRLYYHFRYRDPFSNTVHRINNDYYCFVGYNRMYHNDCEAQNGWVATPAGHTNGWTRSNPVPVRTSSNQDIGSGRLVELYSPGFDVTTGSGNIWRTQISRAVNQQTGDITFTSLGDTSTITSPNIDLTDAKNVFLSFYVYYHNFFANSNVGLNVEVSFDGGATWRVAPPNKTLRGRNKPTNWNWERVYANVTKVKEEGDVFGNNFRVRFVANSNAINMGFVVLIDEIEILNTESENNIYDNFVNSSDITVSPNPANDMVSLTFPRAFYSPEIQILNTLGTEVMNISFNGEFNTVPVNIQGLANGIYFIRIKSEGKNYQTKLSVIR